MSGLVGSALANPTDLIKVRMQAWEGEPKSARWHIKKVYNTWGITGFYTAVAPTVTRAMMVTAT